MNRLIILSFNGFCKMSDKQPRRCSTDSRDTEQSSESSDFSVSQHITWSAPCLGTSNWLITIYFQWLEHSTSCRFHHGKRGRENGGTMFIPIFKRRRAFKLRHCRSRRCFKLCVAAQKNKCMTKQKPGRFFFPVKLRPAILLMWIKCWLYSVHIQSIPLSMCKLALF